MSQCADTGQLQGPTAIYEIAQLLMVAVRDQLAQSLGGKVNRACVVPGDIAADDCECGALAVSAQRFFLSEDFPETSDTGGGFRTSPCDVPWLVAEITVQVFRCAPQPGEGKLAPTCAQQDAAAKILLSDAYVTLTTVVSTLCALSDANRIIDYILGEQQTEGGDGGCVGTSLTVQVGIPR